MCPMPLPCYNKTMKKFILYFCLFLILLSLFAAGALVFVHHATDPSRRLPGNYQAQIDYTRNIVDKGNQYLQDAFLGDQVSVEDYLDPICIDLHLTFSKEGTYLLEVDASSYARAEETAYAALKQALYELIRLRQEAAGKSARSDEEIQSVLEELLGMPADEYLQTYGPSLLPSYEELEAAYAGSGTYEATRDLLILEGGKTRHILTDASTLVLTDPAGEEDPMVWYVDPQP